MGESVLDKHFVVDYRRHVSNLLANFDHDEAMSLAVGGNYLQAGETEADVLEHFGLQEGMKILDLGCGSGRLSSVLSKRFKSLQYLGTDVVSELLAYAATHSSEDYEFLLHDELSCPAPDQSLDFACAFSVFTHLHPAETYLYLSDIRRALKPGGALVFSFLEFGEKEHWPVFVATVEQTLAGNSPHLNSFIEKSVLQLWASQIGYSVQEFVTFREQIEGVPPLGQSIAVFRA